MLTAPVTCLASDQNGNPVAGARITAKLNQTEVYQGLIVPEQVSVVADAQGMAVLNLWPNALGTQGSTYRITAVNPDTGKKYLDAQVSVPNSPCNLHQILLLEPYPPIDAAQQAIATAQAALALVTAQAGIATAQAVNASASANSAAIQAAAASNLAAAAESFASIAQAQAMGAATSANAAIAAQAATQAVQTAHAAQFVNMATQLLSIQATVVLTNPL